METQKLQAFVTVAATRSYTEAAAQLFTTQATVSKQILALEKQLGVKLFSRTHRQVELTPDGMILLPKAQAVVTAANALTAAATRQQHAQHAILRIKTIPSISNYRAFNQIASFHRKYPEVKLQISEGESDALAAALTAGSVDIVFTRLLAGPVRSNETFIGEQDELCVLLPKSNSLARKKSLTVADLHGADLLLLGESTHLFQPVAQLFARAGVTPHITYKGQRIDLILGMISRGLGVSIMMAKAIDLSDYPSLTTVKLTPTVSSQLAFVRRKGHNSSASDQFWNFIHQRKYLKSGDYSNLE
ncbi:LysR family transcriptional regulator [Lacticaseibacillus zhaodongensis]|uniref:LysR family transcriptional regulator n=1 Tax=Lacticaseibacillus zhaodongensis TaxID=2668065 RepID=UPI0018AF7F78|nr:LysR family transcriptional regulator [Lacticaseibacillus zhaodongensis]